MAQIGKPIDRVDAFLKVTGTAKYAAEFNPKNMAYGFPVRATIGKGSITSFDTDAAQKTKGVIQILTHENAPRLRAADPEALQKAGSLPGENLAPMQDNKVYYYGQYIAVVVAETYEQARAAAALVKVAYNKETPAVDLKTELPNGTKPVETPAVDLKTELPNGTKPVKFMGEDVQINAGKTAGILAAAPVKVDHTYSTPTENHHPIEMLATIAMWGAKDKLLMYEATQGVLGVRGAMSFFFNLKPENVQILSPYTGGGFGCKGNQWPHMMVAAMAAQVVSRPVKVVITRQMMQTNAGRRPETLQKVALSAGTDGQLTAMRHHTDTYTNLVDYIESCGIQTKVLYKAPVREITYVTTNLNIGAPTPMRAPGETPGTFALESAMDELAYELKMDPVQLRMLNHTAEDPLTKYPFSSEYLRECYKIGAEKFGWDKRKAQPRQVRNGNHLVGYGMATATYPGIRSAASVKMQMMADGSVIVMSATQDIGTGTYTIMAQTAADALGVPVSKITVKLGDSSLPPAPVSGGSTTTASVTPAVLEAGKMLRKDLLQLALADSKSKLKGRNADEIDFNDGRFFVKNDRSKNDLYTDIIRRSKKQVMEVCTTAMPASGSGLGSPQVPCNLAPIPEDTNSNNKKYSFHSFGAQFAEVWVDEDLGTIRVKRFVSVIDAGTIMNEKTARSQIIGGVIFGFGSALMEETAYDTRWANPVTRTLGDYHVPVNLDVPPIDVYFIGKPDPHISSTGARGVGEIGITGVSAAIANAIFNATGKRLRDLPFTPDKLV